MEKTVLCFLLLFLLSAPVSLFGQQDSSLFEIWEYGYLSNDTFSPRQTVSEKWGIQFVAIAGCIVTYELEDSARRHNEEVYARLAEHYGGDWKDRFYAEVDAEYERQSEVKNLVYQNATYIDLLGNTPHIQLYLTTDDPQSQIYSVHACGWGKWQGEQAYLSFLEFKVDRETQDVRLHSRNPMKLDIMD